MTAQVWQKNFKTYTADNIAREGMDRASSNSLVVVAVVKEDGSEVADCITRQ